MEDRYTGIALAKQGNKGVCVVHGIDALRIRLRNEKPTGGDPFVALVNARTLPDLLLAYEDIRDTDYDTDFTKDSFVTDPEAPSPDDAAGICAMFADGSPTKTALAKTREAIGVWGVGHLTEGNGEPFGRADGDRHLVYACTPLGVLVEAADDLRRHALLLSWLIGKTDFATAHGITPGDKSAKFKTLFKAREGQLLGYYRGLEDAPANFYNSINAKSASIEHVHLYNHEEIEHDVVSYVTSVFDLMMSDETRKLDRNLHPYVSSNTVLSAMWTRFANGIDQEDGAGSLGVCRRCGKFFERKRSTRLYCSESCRVMATRDRAEGKGCRPEPEPTEISRARAERRAELAEGYARTDAMLREAGLRVYDDGDVIIGPSGTKA